MTDYVVNQRTGAVHAVGCPDAGRVRITNLSPWNPDEQHLTPGVVPHPHCLPNGLPKGTPSSQPSDAQRADHFEHLYREASAGTCGYSGLTLDRCKSTDLCDCFDFEWVRRA